MTAVVRRAHEAPLDSGCASAYIMRSVTALGVLAMPIDDRPTIAAPDDDPYLWLEEI